MRLDADNLENILFEYLDQIKVLISPEIWGNILLDCSKNELLILILLYRKTEVNMSQAAEYMQVPLNTATGIVARMERKKMINRGRSREDKRVVTITLTDNGKQQIKNILEELFYYGQRILESLTMEELALAGHVLDKVIAVLGEEQKKGAERPVKKVRKIDIE